jgi:hypothetical protein
MITIPPPHLAAEEAANLPAGQLYETCIYFNAQPRHRAEMKDTVEDGIVGYRGNTVALARVIGVIGRREA